MGDLAATDSYPPAGSAELAPQTKAGRTATVAPSKKDMLIKELACHATLIIAGWSDASSGPLIPYIQRHFGIGYTTVSLLFVGQMVGFLVGAFSNGHLTARYGIGKVITIGSIVQALGYVFLVPAWAFPTFPIFYAVVGFGMSLQDAQANTFVATLPNCDHKLHLLHASYGLGAVVCPLAATAFASSGIKFSYFYCLSIALAFVNVAILLWGFKFSYRIPQDDADPSEQANDIPLRHLGHADDVEKNTPPPSPTAAAAQSQPQSQSEPEPQAQPEMLVRPRRGPLGETLRMGRLWLFSIFIVLYVGAEVSTGGWVVVFSRQERGGGESAGYIATGFWLGLLLGRATLSLLTVKVGEKRVMFLYLGIALALQFAVWFADSLIGNAVTFGLIGYAMGPAYPITITVASRVIPRRLHATAIGFIAAFGQLGAAIFPFCTGALAQKTSPAALQPIMVTLLAAMMVIWLFVKDASKKVD